MVELEPEIVEAAQERARSELATIDRQAIEAKQMLDRNLPTLAELRKGGALVIWDGIRKLMSGEVQYRNADELTKSLARIMDIMQGAEMQAFGEEVAKVDPADRKAVLAEARALVAARQPKT